MRLWNSSQEVANVPWARINVSVGQKALSNKRKWQFCGELTPVNHRRRDL
jgi:hypothetical protein